MKAMAKRGFGLLRPGMDAVLGAFCAAAVSAIVMAAYHMDWAAPAIAGGLAIVLLGMAVAYDIGIERQRQK